MKKIKEMLPFVESPIGRKLETITTLKEHLRNTVSP